MSAGTVAPCYLCDKKYTWPPGWPPLKICDSCRHIHLKPERAAPEPDPTPPAYGYTR